MNKNVVALVVLSLVLASHAGAGIVEYGAGTFPLPFNNGDWGYANGGLDCDTRVPIATPAMPGIYNPVRVGGSVGWSAFVWDAPENEVITSITFTYWRNFGYWTPSLFAETSAIGAATYDASSKASLLAETKWTGGIGGWANYTGGTVTVNFTEEDGYTSLALGVIAESTLTPGHPGLGDIGYGLYECLRLDYASITTVPVPEPATMSLLGCGVVGMLLRRKR